MASSSETETIDVEYETELRDSNRNKLRKKFIAIPDRYVNRMIQSGFMKAFIQLIDEVDEETEKAEKQLLKRLHSQVENDRVVDDDPEPSRKRIATATATQTDSQPILLELEDLQDINDEFDLARTFAIQTFYGTDHEQQSATAPILKLL